MSEVTTQRDESVPRVHSKACWSWELEGGDGDKETQVSEQEEERK